MYFVGILDDGLRFIAEDIQLIASSLPLLKTFDILLLQGCPPPLRLAHISTDLH